MQNKHEKTASVFEHRDGQTETDKSHQTNPVPAPILQQDTTGRNSFVSSTLQHGKGNAMPGKVLVDILKLKNLRELTLIIERERRQGSPICASVDIGNSGYYLAGSANEMKAYIKSLNRRIVNTTRTRDSCAKTLKNLK